MSESLTAQLVDFINAKPVSDADLDAAALFVLDAIANTVGGRNSDPGRRLTAWAAADAGNSRPDTGKQAFLLGALTHILETDDLHRGSVVHPGCVVVPPAWVLAVARAVSGRAFLTAVLHGFEATTRVGMAVGAEHYRIWHNTATCGPFGSAMAAATLLGLDREQTVHALGNAGSQASGLWEFLETGAMTKHLHAGHACEAGVRAAELAVHGFTGPPKILEGEKGFFRAACPDADPSAVMANPDAPWQLTVTSIKPWPSCRHTHPAIDAAGALRKRLLADGKSLGDVQSVRLQVYQAGLDVCDRPVPTSDYEAKFSLQHAAAAALSYDVVDFDAFGDAARTAVSEMRAKVSIELGNAEEAAYPLSWGSTVSVELRDGTQLEERRTDAKGDPEAPLSREEMVAKARMLLAHAEMQNADDFIARILDLAHDGPLPVLPA